MREENGDQPMANKVADLPEKREGKCRGIFKSARIQEKRVGGHHQIIEQLRDGSARFSKFQKGNAKKTQDS